MIREKISVPKSTLSNWLSQTLFIPNKEVLDRVGRAKLKSALYKQKKKLENIAMMKAQARKEVGNISQRDFFMLGIGLYMGEGSKANEQVRFVNSDPQMMRIITKWLKKYCGVKIKNIKITIHGYPDTNQKESVKYWSKKTGVPSNQFTKVNIDKRQNKSVWKRNSLPYGTAHLYARGLKLGVKSLHRRIMGWIETVAKQS